jgi:hypothetical protein
VNNHLVVMGQDCTAIQPTRHKISAVEQKKREDAANFACASVRLEGFQVSDEYALQVRRFTRGDISFPELTDAVHEQIVRSPDSFTVVT